MGKDQIRPGKITKLVHVRFAADAVGDETNLDGCDGYGILQGVDGQEVFFVDNAVQDAPFNELETGQDALYIIEPGPLGRAAKVWVATSQALNCSRERDAFVRAERGKSQTRPRGATLPPES